MFDKLQLCNFYKNKLSVSYFCVIKQLSTNNLNKSDQLPN